MIFGFRFGKWHIFGDRFEVGLGDLVFRIQLQGALVCVLRGFCLTSLIKAHGQGQEILDIFRFQFHQFAKDPSGIIVTVLIQVYLAHEMEHLRRFRVDFHRQAKGGFKFIITICHVTGHRQTCVRHGVARLQFDEVAEMPSRFLKLFLLEQP